MRRIQLFYHDISEIVGGNGFSVVRLTDASKRLTLTVICDKPMTDQITIRTSHLPQRRQMLPEVLVQMLMAEGNDDFELMVYDVDDGQYRVTLLNKKTLSLRTIRMSDAVLLNVIAHIPIYIDEALMMRQCSPFKADSSGLHIPINTIATDKLNEELQRAIDNEDYRLASHLHEEILKRNKKQ